MAYNFSTITYDHIKPGETTRIMQFTFQSDKKCIEKMILLLTLGLVFRVTANEEGKRENILINYIKCMRGLTTY